MTIDLRPHVESTTMVELKMPGNTCYCLLLDKGSVYEDQTLHNFTPDLYSCHGNIMLATSKNGLRQ